MKKTIHINLKKTVDNSYDIQIGMDLKSTYNEIKDTYPHSKIFIITDSNVNKYYGKTIEKSFGKNNLLIVPAGEKSKNRRTKELLEDKLLSMNVSRDSLIVAFGGGVVGDLAGFVASTLLRGVPYIQIPTTLLSQVDSSIGGKVAVDHPLGKNLIGAFYQPKKVYIDINTLRTLPKKEFRNGMSEVIKYAAILDRNLFSLLEQNHSKITNLHLSSILNLINRCCELKKMVVEKDEKENGLRRILNFGHTIGHAIESLSKYKLSHGEAVAIGMVAEAKISVLMGLLRDNDLFRIINILKSYNLPTQIPQRMDLKQIVQATLNDKKIRSGEVQYTLLQKIGKASVGISLSEKAVLKFLSA